MTVRTHLCPLVPSACSWHRALRRLGQRWRSAPLTALKGPVLSLAPCRAVPFPCRARPLRLNVLRFGPWRCTCTFGTVAGRDHAHRSRQWNRVAHSPAWCRVLGTRRVAAPAPRPRCCGCCAVQAKSATMRSTRVSSSAASFSSRWTSSEVCLLSFLRACGAQHAAASDATRLARTHARTHGTARGNMRGAHAPGG